MSNPSTPRPPQAGATQNGNQPARPNPVATVMPNWPRFITQAKAGVMPPASIKAIRQLLKSSVRMMLYQGYISYRKNIYDDLPPVLDPRIAWGNEPATLSNEDYERESQTVHSELERIRNAQAMGVNANMNKGSAAPSTSSGANTPTHAGVSNVQAAGSSPAASSAASSPKISAQVRPPVAAGPSSQAGAKAIAPKANAAPNANPTGPNANIRPNQSVPNLNSPARPTLLPAFTVPPHIMPLNELKQYIAIRDFNERNARLEAVPGLKARYDTSLEFYQAKQRSNAAIQQQQQQQQQQQLQQGQATPARPVRPPGGNVAPASGSTSTPGAGPSNTSSPSITQATTPITSSNPPVGQMANPTNIAPQRPPRPIASASNPTINPAQVQSPPPPQPAAVSNARAPQPIRPATPPVNTNTNIRPAPIAPSPTAAPAAASSTANPNTSAKANAKSEPDPGSTPAQPIAIPATPEAQPTSGPPVPDPSIPPSQPQPQSQPPPPPQPQAQTQSQPQPQSQPQVPDQGPNQPGPNVNPNLNMIPNPHHNQPNYPHPPMIPAGNVFPGLPPKPFDLTLPPQRQFQQPPPPPQPAPPPPPPIPIESEIDRRKRKLREYLAEEAPGMEIESGVYNIVNEYLDLFIEDAIEGAIRLSKHRKSAKVDLKDMALAIEMKHDMKVPGFNVQLPQKTHVPMEGERKRGKAVAPRAARKP